MRERQSELNKWSLNEVSPQTSHVFFSSKNVDPSYNSGASIQRSREYETQRALTAGSTILEPHSLSPQREGGNKGAKSAVSSLVALELGHSRM